MTTIILHFLLFFLVAFFNGFFFLNFFNKRQLNNNFFEIPLIGIVITALLAQFINFFVPLNNYVFYFNLIFILIFFIFNKKEFKRKFEINYLLILPIFILIIVNIYGSKFSDDLNHYHYSYILNTDNFNYIIGLNHLHWHFGISPIWLIANSYFNFDHSRLQDIHVLNGLLLFLILNLFLSEIFQSFKKKKKNIYIPVIFLISIFILLKYSRLKEFGIDRPAFLLFYFLIYYYVKNFFIGTNKFNNNDVYVLTIISMSIIFIKIIFLPIIIIPIYFFLIDKKLSLLRDKKIILIGLVGVSYFLKNFLISGCLIYPVEFMCFETVSWNDKLMAKVLSRSGELANTSWPSYTGLLTEKEYVKNFNWFKTWISRNLIELSSFAFTSLLALFITLLSFSKKLKSSSKENFYTHKSKKITTVLSIVLFFCLIIFFIKVPVIRMFHHAFIITAIIFLILLIKKKELKMKNNFIIFFLIIGFLFNGSKNLVRIKDNNYMNNPLKQIYSEGLDRPSTTKKIDNFIYYDGWMGPSPTGGGASLVGFNHKKILFFNMIYKKN